MTSIGAAERAQTLRELRTFAQVFQYLVDDQGWPLDLSDLLDDDLTDVTYDWDPEELGIEADRLGDLKRLQQMRPLTVRQPWGVFFLEFSGPRLRYTPIRRLLRALVTRKRAAGSTDRPTWTLNNLLFIVITGTGDDVEIHFLAFKGSDPQKAEFRSLAWRPVHAPTRHLQRLSEELLPYLAWPENESDTEGWNTSWWEAFKLPVGQAIKDSARLADRMAKTARDLREQMREALEMEDGSGPFSVLLEEIRTQLVSDVDEEKFADMCAQTLVYGMLGSRVTNPEDFGSSPIFSTVAVANPFLETLFEQIHDEAVSLDLPGSGLTQLVADLRETNVEAILDQIGSTAKGGDPIIHFYEEFLKKYDGRMRADAGAFYTPQPAVEFMVRAVDDVLRSRFGLKLGIADATPWREVAERNGFDVPENTGSDKPFDPDKPFVSMVDPATGTGTFLVEWLRQARRSFEEFNKTDETNTQGMFSGFNRSGRLSRSGTPGGSDTWSQHARNIVLPSMHAFELMLAPYAIAHLKVALELGETQANTRTAQILLTDTLDHAPREDRFSTMSDLIAEEGQRATELKEKERFTVVVGNPPYNREQHAVGDTGKRKGGVVRHGAPGIAPLIKAVTEPMKAAGLGHHLKNVYNDYVYFWCWAVWQTTDLPPGPGVVAFITASSYLNGVSMGGVRHLLRQAFDELWIVDLGGEGRGALKEENIFDIQTPVAIAVGVRTGKTSEHAGRCKVRYLRIAGTLSEKLARLRQISLTDIAEEVPGRNLDRMTPQSDSEYYDWSKITDLFPWIRSGCKLGRTWPIAETKRSLQQRWRELISVVPRRRSEVFVDTSSGQKSTKTPLPLLATGPRLHSVEQLDAGDNPEGYRRYGYRSLDRQWIIADQRLIDRAGPDLWRVRGSHQVFLTTLTSTKLGTGSALTVTPYVPDLHHFSARGDKGIMPLYRDPDGQIPNITHGLFAILSERLNIKVTAEDLLAYVYALGGTPAFTEQFNAELTEAAGPIHIPITTEADLFQQAMELGRDLLWWHTWGERFTPTGSPRLPKGQAKQITPMEGMPEDYFYDPKSQTLMVGSGSFAPVSQEAWEFEVSGLKVLQSWLGYRKKNRRGKKSSPLDEIRPTRWTQTNELLLVLAVIEHTIKVTPKAAALLQQIITNPLIPAADLPTPEPTDRKPPRFRSRNSRSLVKRTNSTAGSKNKTSGLDD